MADIDTGILLHFQLDEKAGAAAADSSGGGRTGTAVNAPAWTTGRIGGGLLLASASSQYVSFSSLSRTDSEAWTWSAWIKFTDTLANNTLSGDGASANNAINKASNTSIVVRTAAATNRAFTVGSLNATTFRHIVVTREAGGDIRVYVDSVASVSNPISDAGAMTFARLGMRNSDQFLNAAADDVRVYGRALSAEDIASLFAWRGSFSPLGIYDIPGHYT